LRTKLRRAPSRICRVRASRCYRETRGIQDPRLAQDGNVTEEAAEHSKANWQKMLSGLKSVAEGNE